MYTQPMFADCVRNEITTDAEAPLGDGAKTAATTTIGLHSEIVGRG